MRADRDFYIEFQFVRLAKCHIFIKHPMYEVFSSERLYFNNYSIITKEGILSRKDADYPKQLTVCNLGRTWHHTGSQDQTAFMETITELQSHSLVNKRRSLPCLSTHVPIKIHLIRYCLLSLVPELATQF